MATNSTSLPSSARNEPSGCAECARLRSVNSELLASLRTMVAHLSDACPLGPSNDELDMLRDAEAAIAKAEGH